MKKPYKIIKIGGNELADSEFTQGLSAAIKVQQKKYACILVHGGGQAIDQPAVNSRHGFGAWNRVQHAMSGEVIVHRQFGNAETELAPGSFHQRQEIRQESEMGA